VVYVFKNLKIKHFERTGVADGGSFDVEEKIGVSGVLKYILINMNGSRPTKSTITILLDDEPITRDRTLCKIFGDSVNVAIELDKRVSDTTVFKCEGVNKEGATVDVSIDLLIDAV